MKKNLLHLCHEKYKKGRRLIAPLLGTPGTGLINSTIKIVQQNSQAHYQAITALHAAFKPDIIFPLMDLSVEANALGRYTVFPRDDNPTVPADNFDISELEQMKQINISGDSRVQTYVETAALLHKDFKRTVIQGAYVSGPYSLASLLIGSEQAAMWCITEPEKLLEVCRLATGVIKEYITMLARAGADVICILEPSAVMLGQKQFEKFSAAFIKEILKVNYYGRPDFLYHVCGNAMHLIESMTKTGIHGLSLDSAEAGIDIIKVLEQINEETIVLGNINPASTLLKGPPEKLAKETFALLYNTRHYPNFILSTGCDIVRKTPLEHLHIFMNTGKNFIIKDNK
ncbi:MAG TPA: uroporphyrinogen decarboxylase family protein [Spirochaetota bacterium]|nr:uroporphyrinogen decarboxylase family protein [Spirochaetota bacterium]